MKIKTKFVCQSCGASYPAWNGKCSACGEWNTMVEEIVKLVHGSQSTVHRDVEIKKLSEVDGDNFKRLKTNIGEFDRVLGGGIVPGSLVLIGGDPGIGKSTLVLQTAKQLVHRSQFTDHGNRKDGLSTMNSELKTILYSSGEESVNQIKLRAERLNIDSDNILLLGETNIETIISAAEKEKHTLLIVDSIQTMWSEDLAGAPGNVGQVSMCTTKLMDFAKKNHVAVFVVGHVTKEGNIAGPKVLEHLVDVVLYLEGDRDRDFRILRGVKNRFGSTNETGIFEMQGVGLIEVSNPSELLLSEREENSPGSVIFPTMEGTRPLLVEVQALTSTTNFGYPKRTAIGFDQNRLQLLVAVLQKRAGINLFNQDIYVNIVGGLKIAEPALDLAVCLAIASSFKNKSLQKDLCAIGEVGLAGEVRNVHNISERVKEAEKLGYKKCVVPASSKSKGLVSVKDVREAIKTVISG